MKGAGNQEEEVKAMGTKMRALSGCRVVVAGLFILAVMVSAVGCGTSSLASYRASLQDTGAPKFKVYNRKVEHNMFNSTYQQGKEDWEDD